MRLCTFSLLSLLCCSPAFAADEYLSFTSQAVDADSSAALYTENYYLHTVDGQLRERVVVYTCAGAPDQAFARKEVTVSDPFKPSFRLQDDLRGYLEGFDAGSGRIYFRPGRDAEEQSATVETTPNLVVDSGFDEFVLRNWAALVGGEKMVVDFVVPSQQEALGFKLKHLHSETVLGRKAEVFRLALSGLLGLIASGIDVSYDSENRTLLRFEGLSNLRDAEGDNYTARIDFPPAARRVLADAGELSAAKQRPLVQSCK